MKRASTIVDIPLYHGVTGSLIESPWTQSGQPLTQKIHWVVPMEISWPDGWGISNFSIVPRLASYVDLIEFKIYDKRQLAVPKYIGSVKIDSADDNYEIYLEPQYRKYRLSISFSITHVPREPNESFAFANGTPYGEWKYKDQI